MSEVTVKQLAATVGIAVERLLAQLREAGIAAAGADASLTEQEKLQLLAYLRRSHGKKEGETGAAPDWRKSLSELRQPVVAPRSASTASRSGLTARPAPAAARGKVVSVEVERRSTYVKRAGAAEGETGAAPDRVTLTPETVRVSRLPPAVTRGPEMVIIPAGSFLMGSPEGEEGRSDAEGPQHRVTLARPFAIGRYAVTFEEYDAFCAATGRDKPGDQGWGRGRLPVINVSWEDGVAYCQWLSEQTGKPYRLPSEAEWEYAARAGTATPFHFGATLSTAQANYNGDYPYGSSAKGEYRQRTVAVESLPANPWGLHEVHGNVCEWVQDCWHDSYRGAPVDGSAWQENCDGARRVFRGGSWGRGGSYSRVSSRARLDAGNRPSSIGLRLAQDL